MQWIDNDGDGKNDEVVFQAKVDPKKTNSYKIIADIVNYAQKKNKNLSQIKIDEYQKFQKSIDKNIYKYVDINNSLLRKKNTHELKSKRGF